MIFECSEGERVRVMLRSVPIAQKAQKYQNGFENIEII
jgi:hypothetical protein